tara:strand:+ start:14224 stop:15396 length:1173 start_codon:yes stop_codon:yes gene_type:complete
MTINQSLGDEYKGKIKPHGGKLIDLFIPPQEKEKLLKKVDFSHECSDRNACDAELLSIGGFSPLTGFMNQDDYISVVENYKLISGYFFGLPIVLDTNDENIKYGNNILLKYKGQNLGILNVSEKWEPNKVLEAKHCYETTSTEHPAVRMIFSERKKYYLGGKYYAFELPKRDFPCKTPKEVRIDLPENHDVIAFQCRNPIHRAHYELFSNSLTSKNVKKEAVVLVHPTCGPTQQDDIPGRVRFLTYKKLEEELNDPKIRWAYLPYAMHMAGPREALQHMIIRKNYGCTHFIIGRDMAGCKSSLSGDDFYGPYDAQNFANKISHELGMQIIPSKNLVYTIEKGYVTAEFAKDNGLNIQKLSGTQFRQMLRSGENIPEWFAFKSVVDVLRNS